MTVKELINQLNHYDGNMRVMLYSHGRCGVAEQDEIKGCFEEEILSEDDNYIIERVVSLYEY